MYEFEPSSAEDPRDRFPRTPPFRKGQLAIASRQRFTGEYHHPSDICKVRGDPARTLGRAQGVLLPVSGKIRPRQGSRMVPATIASLTSLQLDLDRSQSAQSGFICLRAPSAGAHPSDPPTLDTRSGLVVGLVAIMTLRLESALQD